MSQNGRKRKASKENTVFCTTKETKLEVTTAEKANSAEGIWIAWVPEKLLDQIGLLGIKFEEYIFRGQATCYLRCAPTNSNPCRICKSEPFHTYCSGTRYYKKTLEGFLKRHIESPGQRKIIECIEKQVSEQTSDRKQEVRKKILECMGRTGVSFSFWGSPSFRSLLLVLLGNLPYKNHIIDEICLGRNTLTRFSTDEAERMKKQLKIKLPELAKKGALTVLLDHKHVRQVSNACWKVLGISASWREDGQMRHVLFEYIPTGASDAATTVPILKRILEEFGILQFISNHSVPLCGDQASEKIMRELCDNYTICGSHSISCLLKNACDSNLAPQKKDGYDKWNTLSRFIEACDSYKKADELPCAAAYQSINAYFISKEIKNEQNVKRFYKSVLQGMWRRTELTTEELETEVNEKTENFMKLGLKGKFIERCASSTRFRKTIHATERFLLNEELLQDLCSLQHPQRHLIADIRVPDLEFAKLIMPFMTRVHKGINFMESDYTCGTSYYEELQELFIFAVERISNRNCDADRFARSIICSIVQQICKKRIDHNGNLMTNMVPKRFTKKDISAVFLNPETTMCNFSKVMDLLRHTENRFLKSAKTLLEEELSGWQDIARSWIKDTAWKMFPDPDDLIILEEFDLVDLVEQVPNEGQEYASRLGLGGPKMSKTIEDELAEFQNLNWQDVVNHRAYCSNNSIPAEMIPVEFWNRYSSTFPRLSRIGTMVLGSLISSSSLERQFSLTSLLYSCLRKSLTAETIKNIVLSSTEIN